jgi:YhcH/YjgK/YiaL family protein
MILDSLGRAPVYHLLHPGLPAAFAWLLGRAASAETGRHEVAEGVVAIVDAYRTAPASEKKWETHRRHVDLQVVLSGSELVGWSPVSELTTRIPYNPEKDAEFYESPVFAVTRFRLHPGLFAVFFPGDGHQPGVMEEQPAEVRKVVFKLRI